MNLLTASLMASSGLELRIIPEIRKKAAKILIVVILSLLSVILSMKCAKIITKTGLPFNMAVVVVVAVEGPCC